MDPANAIHWNKLLGLLLLPGPNAQASLSSRTVERERQLRGMGRVWGEVHNPVPLLFANRIVSSTPQDHSLLLRGSDDDEDDDGPRAAK
ncbi:hypothetical protein FSARC_4135 [Fusarium sarcochroum]|uniref:Secreted protein n=1 Tax=Fusarium sarcochroum TaxID=1208366 RepID=A0A8H4U267_9HYPO|nr:hypothetical protein FSARC_4135 [Fusarium sarcochroum]